jgi:glycine cleavage system H protein
MSHPDDRRYTASHEWVQATDDGAFRMGISDHAQDELGDLVFVDLPEVGTSFAAGDGLAVVESVKAAADVYAPCDCEVVAINEQLAEQPELVNNQPHGDGWLLCFKPSGDFDASSLQVAAAYDASL